LPHIRPASRLLAALGIATAIVATGGTPVAAATAPPSAPVPHYDDGLLGAPDVFSATYKHALGLLAIAGIDPTHRTAADSAAATAGLAWLARQQCANGGWQGYKLSGVACGPLSTDPNDSLHYVAADSNTTAAVIQAFAAFGESGGPVPAAVTFLKSLQTSDGGFEFTPGAGSDPNSTALSIQAFLALGTDPATLTKGANTPYTYLAGQQLGCGAAAADRGALQAPFAPGDANLYATVQSVPALAHVAYPVHPAATSTTGGPQLDCSTNPPPAVDAAAVAASWVAAQLTAAGSLDNGFGGVDYPNMAYAVAGFAATGTQSTAAGKVLAYLQSHTAAATTKSGKDDIGGLGLTALAAIAGGSNPKAFGGRDLIARIEGLQYVTPAAPSPSSSPTAVTTPSVAPSTGGVGLPATGRSTGRLGLLGAALVLLGAVLVSGAALPLPVAGRHRA
jgi:hypothetical protein